MCSLTRMCSLPELATQVVTSENLEWYFSMWPSAGISQPWLLLAQRVFEEVHALPVLYCTAGQGRWVAPKDALYVDDSHPGATRVGEALLSDGKMLVHVPREVRDTFAQVGLEIFKAGPKWVRAHLAAAPRSAAWRNLSEHQRRDTHVSLLQYCMADLRPDARPDSEEGRKYAELCGLPIVPAADGKSSQTIRAPVQAVQGSLLVGRPEEIELLERLSADLVDPGLPSGVFEHLRSEAMVTYTNVRVLTPELLAGCLHRVLPAGWDGIPEVQWRVGEDGQPDAAWMRRFWEYASEDRLAAFERWPLIPTCEGTLCVPEIAGKQGIKVVDAAAEFSDKLQGVLTRLGVRILNPEYMSDEARKRLASVVQRPSLRGVLRALGVANHASFEHVCQRVAVLTSEDKRELRAFCLDSRWMMRSECSEEAAAMLLALPVHELCGEAAPDPDPAHSAQAPNEHFTPVEKQRLPPSDVMAQLLTAQYLRASQEEEAAYRFLGVATAKLSEFYVEAVFPRLGGLDKGLCQHAMLCMLEQMPLLCRQDPRFWDRLSHLAFVSTGAERLARASELFDPNVAELEELLEGGEFYPAAPFLRPELISILIRLGLKTSLNRAGVLKIAVKISEEGRAGNAAARKRSSALLRFLDANYSSLVKESTLAVAGKHAASGFKSLIGLVASSTGAEVASAAAVASSATGRPGGDPNAEVEVETFKRELLQLSWVPVLTQAPFEDLPWTEARAAVACMRDVRPKEDLWLLSFFMSIIDGDITSPELRRDFGWNMCGDRSLIAAQLVKLTQIKDINTKPALQEKLNASLLRMYAAFQGVVGKDEFQDIRAILNHAPWVWLGDDFAPAESVAFKCALNARPMLCAVPAELYAYNGLLRAMGVRETFSSVDYVRSLAQLAQKHEGVSLPSADLDLAIAMVQYIADDRHSCQHAPVLVPDLESVLTPAGDLVYNDAPWMGGNTPFGEDFRFVHPKISIDVGEKVGLRSLRRQMLLRTSDLMDIGLQDAEAFGQSESLTGRLRHILELYPDGPGILNELIQNADDARASEVSIVINKASYSSSSLLSPQMDTWQGPAIYFHNNAVFSPHDFKNLCRIGQGAKLDCLGKTGKFGLGFNAVYHFTDLPSFVSGEYVVCFDPHAKFLPGATLQHPGLRIKFTRSNILAQFPDQFKPYLLLGCDLQNEYKVNPNPKPQTPKL